MSPEQLEDTLGGPIVFGTPLWMGKRRWFWKRAEAHLWCADCARTFPNGLQRLVERRRACPYADCTGEMDTRAYLWSEVRTLHPNYPLHPNMAVQYACPPWSRPYRYPGSAPRQAGITAE